MFLIPKMCWLDEEQWCGRSDCMFAGAGRYPQQWCCYGDGIVMEGEVAHSVTDCCLQLVCEGGKLVERRAGSPGTTGCKHNAYLAGH